MKDSFICECFSVTEKDFKEAVNEKKSFLEFQKETKAGTCCGPCTMQSKEIYEKIQKEARR